ncbi:MAG: response regulator transcription factor [Flavobacteriales bacterium]|nr:response regulator transcription factor [Flavobacteriales bacterium]
MRRIKVAIVEDDRDFRDLLLAGMVQNDGIQVVDTFPTGDRFLKALEELDADVVVMDINMPGTSGIDCVARAKPQKPAMQFLMSTVFENPAYIFQALCAGATGYIVKSAPAKDLIAAVYDIHTGGSPMSPAIARAVVGSFQGGTSHAIRDAQLTTKEREVVDGLANGLMYKEIADKLGVNISTVRTHIRSIYDKLQVHSRAEAVKRIYPGR